MSSVRALVIDVRDAVLGAAERAVAASAADAVLDGLGRVALAHPRAKLHVDSDDVAAREALRVACAKLAANLSFEAAPPDALRLRPTTLAEMSWQAHGRADARVVAVGGAVETSRVLLVSSSARVRDLIAGAVPKSRAWVALWGGAQGRIVERDAQLDALDREAARLLLVLPSAHAVVKRARTKTAAWLRRAQSACASCAMCTPACPVSLPVHELLRTLSVGGRRAFSTSRVASAVDCIHCGACDLACPQSLSPARVVGELALKLRAGGVTAPPRRPRVAKFLDEERAAARLGLARYRAPIPALIEAL